MWTWLWLWMLAWLRLLWLWRHGLNLRVEEKLPVLLDEHLLKRNLVILREAHDHAELLLLGAERETLVDLDVLRELLAGIDAPAGEVRAVRLEGFQ